MRDRDPQGRPRSARPRDEYGRPLPHDAEGVPRVPDDYAPTGEEAVAEAVRLLAEERPFHAHEVLEARWKSGPPGERELWQGLAQICVGLTHLQRGNRRGAETLLSRGADRIGSFTRPTGPAPDEGGGRPYGIDVAEAVRCSLSLAARAEEVGPAPAITLIRRTLGG
ncbi:hypothetical protein Misp01_40830 [Microtetraspora sp. NBRC 13810]|uniref:DUF309 domain-containing protein n=1 Tax=Microtetraspora sp. NBRC 13810 TaxID=3030990 RepID=UPI0025570D40|nr:DUF309 domain-containing protein [Microtetraspora sp. NBRC 13810]GLW08953.1 hypothetical protein Misp01_40830 [Microtetraspora sp. NBRC 13810]